jgi:signal transduction histidine kinase
MSTTTSTTQSAAGLPGRLQLLHDALLAAGLTVLGWAHVASMQLLFVSRRPPGPPGGRSNPAADFIREIRVDTPTPLMYAATALAFLPLALRRRFPLWVLGVVTVAAGLYDRFFHAPSITVIAPLIALYTVGTLRSRRTVWIAAAVAFAFTAGLMIPQLSTSRLIGELVRVGATFAVAASLGDATRNRRAYIAEVEERASQAEQTREQEAARRVEEERLRIARELHDVTAHSLSLIAVQAGAAEKVVERDPAAARRALEAIRLTSRSSLAELRAMLGVLRGDEEAAPMSPAGRLEGLTQLVASVEEAGVIVSLEIAGNVADLPAYADVSAYRIVQEALTNVVRHAAATGATVRVLRESDAVLVEVTDDGRTHSAAVVEGHGMAGMRERVSALGGTFEAGPQPGGGFLVSARLPLKRRSAAE